MLLFWYVSLSVVVWTLLYLFINKLNNGKSTEWNCRIVAITHALVVTKSIEMSFWFGEVPFYHIGEENTNIQNIILIISSGYFLFDFAWSVYMGTEGIMMLMHHVVSILCLIGGLLLNHSGPEISVTLWGSELTNPFLQTRWFLRETKNYDTTFGAINDFIFFAIFTYARIGIGSGLGFLFFLSKKSILIMKLGGFIFYVISITWTWQIWKFVKRRYFSGKGFLKCET